MKKMMKQLIFGLVLIALLGTTVSQSVLASPEDYAEEEVDLEGPDIHGEGYCVLDADTGEVLLSKNMNHEFYPASITKVMTALIVLEHVEKLDDTLTFSDYAINSLTSNSSTLSPKAKVGEQMTVRNALYGMMMVSANECSAALAEYVAGSEEQFAELMNQKAKELGCTQTHFVNAHGLHNDAHYTTPYEMLLIFREALKNDTFRVIDATVNYTLPATNLSDARTLRMGHAMLNGDEPAVGVYAGKTGRTYYAGRTLLTAAEHNGHHLLFCVMKSDDYNCYIDTRILMEYAYGMVDGILPVPFAWNMKTETLITTGSVNIREFPSTESLSKGSFPEGTEVTRLGSYGGWSMVQCDSGVYYVSSSMLGGYDASGNLVVDSIPEQISVVPPVTETELEAETKETLWMEENSAAEVSVSEAESTVTTTEQSVDERSEQLKENFLMKAGHFFGNMSTETLTVLMLVFFALSVVLLIALIILLLLIRKWK